MPGRIELAGPNRELPPAALASLQVNGGIAAQNDCSGIQLDGDAGHLEESTARRFKAGHQSDRKSVHFICLYVWLEKYFSRGDYKKR
jgi:hypothetical protein